ncbi:hypothetical protein [Methylobacterium sp.]|uniref:hypothetical protein n=1 Tax=Methylobacterium sp. TaxID=409 RepID=UPI0025F2C62D|nr:hypothetical protein [Methylobacterium sp.]MBY0260127.1 hypothetical protein [Methylobacterium sp.]
MIADSLSRLASEDFGRRDVLTGAEISAIRARLADATTSIGKIDAELADPASGFRQLGGGIGAVRSAW